jgi:hypothetical protein
VAKKVFKGILATDKTDNYWTIFFTWPQQRRGQAKPVIAIANWHLGLLKDLGIAEVLMPEGPDD